MVIYVVVNVKEREAFERRYYLPYGYHTCPIFTYQESAIGYVEKQKDNVRQNLIVEKHENGDMEIVYRGMWYDNSLDEPDNYPFWDVNKDYKKTILNG